MPAFRWCKWTQTNQAAQTFKVSWPFGNSYIFQIGNTKWQLSEPYICCRSGTRSPCENGHRDEQCPQSCRQSLFASADTFRRRLFLHGPEFPSDRKYAGSESIPQASQRRLLSKTGCGGKSTSPLTCQRPFASSHRLLVFQFARELIIFGIAPAFSLDVICGITVRPERESHHKRPRPKSKLRSTIRATLLENTRL